MKQDLTKLSISTQGQGLYNFTTELNRWVESTGVETGLMTVFCRHTSASLTIQENADQDVLRDLQTFFKQTVREDPSLYLHTCEGPDDMPAHIRSALTDVSLSIPVAGGRPVLGTWQGVYLFEHRTRGHNREVVVQVMGV
ncbi:secondary thiamine-phosphate synthase enzyme YjbQ [Pseudomonadota bacterium]